MTNRPVPMITPNIALMASCVRNSWDSRRAASFMAKTVVREFMTDTTRDRCDVAERWLCSVSIFRSTELA
jgi:hypothetical protein